MTTYWQLVERRAAATPDAVVVVDDHGGRVTAAELRDGAERMARALVARSIGPGDTVSWVLPSNASTAVLCASLARLGAVQNPLIPIYGEREIAFITNQAGSALLVTAGTFRGIDFSAMGRAAGVAVVELDELAAGADATLPPPPTDDTAVRWLFYTSGTTADPKGVRHSDRSLVAGAFAMRDNGVRPGGSWGGAFPFGHIGGPSILALALDIEMTLYFSVVFDSVGTCAFLRQHDVEAVVGIGALVNAMLSEQRAHPSERRFPSLRVLLAGGGPKLPGLAAAVRDELGAEIGCSYGMTEIPIVSSANPFAVPPPLDAGEGRATPGVEIRIVGEGGQVLGAGEEGEVRARGPQLFHGYVDESLNDGAFDDEGFFRSGDVGYLAPEGDLVITGRIKDVVIRNGENLSVREIEDLLLQHPAVADATVVGVPDEVTGECVCAVLVLREGETVDLDAVRAFCADRGLMRQKQPERLEVVTALPRNPMGKVIKQQVRSAILASAP